MYLACEGCGALYYSAARRPVASGTCSVCGGTLAPSEPRYQASASAKPPEATACGTTGVEGGRLPN